MPCPSYRPCVRTACPGQTGVRGTRATEKAWISRWLRGVPLPEVPENFRSQRTTVFQRSGNPLFAKDGEIYDFNGRKAIAIGGAYSVDKYYRLSHGMEWFDTEQPSDELKAYVEEQLEKCSWHVDYVLSHTVPIEAEPVWAFIPGLDQSAVDKSTEKWLQSIYDKLVFSKWYAGHYHVESDEGDIRIMFEDYDELCDED